jgi:hypothetical protein
MQSTNDNYKKVLGVIHDPFEEFAHKKFSLNLEIFDNSNNISTNNQSLNSYISNKRADRDSPILKVKL